MVVADKLNVQYAAWPEPRLRPFVHRYTWHAFAGFEPGEHLGFPSRHVIVMVSFDDPFQITRLPSGQAPGCWQAFAGGLHASPATVAHEGHGRGLGLDITPLGARALLGLPAGALAGSVVDLRELWGSAADRLMDQFDLLTDWGARTRLLDATLAALIDERGRLAGEVGYAWDRLFASGGRVRVTHLADELGCSRRHLSSRFQREFGLSPKQAARVMRFERASAALTQGGRPADVAAACGYFDQSHLNEEWKALTGITPLQWLTLEVRDLDDHEFGSLFPEVQDAPG